MISKIKIEDQVLVPPQVITVGQFEALGPWNVENREHAPFVCAILYNQPVELFKKVPNYELSIMMSLALQPIQHLNSVEVQHQVMGHSLLNLDEMTFGNFVDLDVLTQKGSLNNLVNIIAILYDVEIETAAEWNIMESWGALKTWLDWRSQFYRKYSEFFNLDAMGGGDSDETVSIESAWYSAIMVLAGEDFLKIHQVTERGVVEALNYLAYKKDQNARLKQQLKKQEMKLKAIR